MRARKNMRVVITPQEVLTLDRLVTQSGLTRLVPVPCPQESVPVQGKRFQVYEDPTFQFLWQGPIFIRALIEDWWRMKCRYEGITRYAHEEKAREEARSAGQV